MSKENVSETQEVPAAEQKKEFSVTIMVSDQNLSYKSDFHEAETIFWLEAVKNLILKKTFETVGLE